MTVSTALIAATITVETALMDGTKTVETTEVPVSRRAPPSEQRTARRVGEQHHARARRDVRRSGVGGRVRLLLADVRIGAYSAVVQAVRYYNESRGVSNFRKLHPCVLPPNTKNGIMCGNRVNLAL